MRKQQGKFWPHVRALIWEKAEELFMQEQARTMDCYIKPEKCFFCQGTAKIGPSEFVRALI